MLAQFIGPDFGSKGPSLSSAGGNVSCSRMIHFTHILPLSTEWGKMTKWQEKVCSERHPSGRGKGVVEAIFLYLKPELKRLALSR